MSRAEYMKEYRKEQKIKKLKQELEQIKKDNPWFDPDFNFYFSPQPLDVIQKWNNENEKRFLLQYEIDHPHCSAAQKRQAFRKSAMEKDLIDRINKYRAFYKSVFLRKKRSPSQLECFENNIVKPDLSERHDLLHLLLPKEDDPIIPVCITDDWVVKDDFMLDNEISDSDSEGWPEGWALEYYDFYGTGPGFYSDR